MGTVKRGGPLRSRSPKRLAEAELRAQVLQDVAWRDGPYCYAERLVPQVPCRVYGGRKPLEGHEVIARSQWPGGHLVADNVRLLCPAHHDWATRNAVTPEHPEGEAHAVGLHGRSWERPA